MRNWIEGAKKILAILKKKNVFLYIWSENELEMPLGFALTSSFSWLKKACSF